MKARPPHKLFYSPALLVLFGGPLLAIGIPLWVARKITER